MAGSEGIFVRPFDKTLLTAANAVGANEMWQTADGRAAVFESTAAASSGTRVTFTQSGKFTVPKATGVAFLDGGRAYWDHSANVATYRKNNDRDFYLGRVVGDYGENDAFAVIDLNIDPPYDIDIARDTFITSITGTQALNGLGLWRRGGAHQFVLSSTSEAQKLDILSQDGFAVGANAIVEFAFNVVNDGAGTAVDVSLGVANGTHGTDADSITESVFIHLDANNTQINAESDDGTTEVAATDTTLDYVESATVANRVECWMDLRNPASVAVYVNGARVLSGTTFNINAAVGPLFLLAHIEKTSAADVYELALHWLRARFMEQ